VCWAAISNWFLLVKSRLRSLSPITCGSVKLCTEGGGMTDPPVSTARNDCLTTTTFCGVRGTCLPITLILSMFLCLLIIGFSGMGVKFISSRFTLIFISVDMDFSSVLRFFDKCV